MEAKPCADCHVQPGQQHIPGCDVARCMFTGLQRVQCEDCQHCPACQCPPCPQDVWTGQWPGDAECAEFGWYAYFGERGWARCTAAHPGAQPDLNRLIAEAVWDRQVKRWRTA